MKQQVTTIAESRKKEVKKQKKQPIKLGKKIRNLNIDLGTNLFILLMLLVVFNCVFIISALMLAHWINIWWVWLIDLVVSILCVVYSVCSYLYCVKNYCFALYENCLVLNSMWYYNTVIELKLVKQVEVKTGFWDRVFGRGTCTLVLRLNDESQTKIKLYFLKENIAQLKDELYRVILASKGAKNRKNAN